jgi:4-amino-4-deoxy-L-arabinose transferase-like glycosyltransferase
MLIFGGRASHWILLGAFLGAILLFQLGTRGLNEPDEGRYANIALESLEMDHPWWEPQVADVGHYDKPPLTYWISALGYEIFGVNAWGARLPSFLGALLTLAGVGWMAFRRYGAQAAWLAVLVAGTLFQIWLWGRLLSCDMLLTGWCTLAIAAWAETRHRHGSYAAWVWQILFWSLAGWTKATPALIPMLGLAIYVYAAGDAEDRRALKLPFLLPLVILGSIPWYVIVLESHPGLYNFFFHRELVQRLSGHIDGRAGPIYYYLPLCLLGWLPWWPLAGAALLRQWSALRRENWRSLLSPGLCLVLTGFVIFSLVGSKHATYLLPFAPWAALEISRLLGRDPLLRRPAVILPVAGVAAGVYLTVVALIPGRESQMGMHSSLREVADILRQHHAGDVYSDHFWPSLEVYYGEKIHFAEAAPEETYDRADEPDEHFGFNDQASLAGRWFVHFRKEKDPEFRRWLNNPNVSKIVVGDFIVGPMTPPAWAAFEAPGSGKRMLADGKFHLLPQAAGKTLR